MTNFMPKAGLIFFFFVLFFLYGQFGPGIPIHSISTVTTKQDLFTVSGVGKVTAVPDMAYVTLGITANSSNVKSAQSQANTIINKVADNLKSLGVDSKDIKTTSYYISPSYDYQSGTNRITGYTVSINLSVTVRNLDQVNTVIDQSTAAGITNIGGIQLTINEVKQKELARQARDQAVTEAKTRAQELSSSAGLSLGKIINIQENNTAQPIPMYEKSALSSDMLGFGGGTNIQAGSADITSSVTLTYEVR